MARHTMRGERMTEVVLQLRGTMNDKQQLRDAAKEAGMDIAGLVRKILFEAKILTP